MDIFYRSGARPHSGGFMAAARLFRRSIQAHLTRIRKQLLRIVASLARCYPKPAPKRPNEGRLIRKAKHERKLCARELLAANQVDRELAAGLRRIAPPRVQVVTGDILSQDLAELVAAATPWQASRPVRVVGNLPYNLSSPILFQILGTQRTHRCFRDATLLLQREVADRVVAAPCSRAYGPMAILTRLAADAKRVITLPPGAFRPPPRVRSAVVTLGFRPPPVSIADPALFERLVRSLFTRRRKTLLNAFGPFAGTVSPLPPRELLARAGLASDRRPETLDLEDLATLADTLARR